MHRLIKLLITKFLVFACLLLPAGCGPQGPVAASVDCRQPCKPQTPQILFISKEHDFGKVPFGSEQTCSFEFLNDGGKDLVIENIHTSCGCTATQAENTTIPPGKASAITESLSFAATPKSNYPAMIHPANPLKAPAQTSTASTMSTPSTMSILSILSIKNPQAPAASQQPPGPPSLPLKKKDPYNNQGVISALRCASTEEHGGARQEQARLRKTGSPVLRNPR